MHLELLAIHPLCLFFSRFFFKYLLKTIPLLGQSEELALAERAVMWKMQASLTQGDLAANRLL